MDVKPKEKWYFKISVVIIAFLCVGPLALPLVLFNPRFSQRTKLVITVIVILLSYYLAVSLISALGTINQYYRLAF